MRVRLVAALLLGAGLNAGCGCRTPPEYGRIFVLPRDRWKDEFIKLPLEGQVEMYLYAGCQEPPADGFADYLASNGQQVVPFILERIEKQQKDYTTHDLTYVLVVIHRRYCDLHGQAEVIARLKRDVAKMKDPGLRSECFAWIREIETEPGADAKPRASP